MAARGPTTTLFQVPFSCHSISSYRAPRTQTADSPNCGATTALSLGLISNQFADLLTFKRKGLFMNNWQGFLERRGITTQARSNIETSIPAMSDETTLHPDMMNYLRTSLFPQCGTFALMTSSAGGIGHAFTIIKGFKFSLNARERLDCKKDLGSDQLFIFDAQSNNVIPESRWPAYFLATINAFRDRFKQPRVPVSTAMLGGFMYLEPKTQTEVVDEYINGPGAALLTKARIGNPVRGDPIVDEAIEMDLDDDSVESTLAAARQIHRAAQGGRLTRRRSSLPKRKAGRSSSARTRRYSRRMTA